MNLLELPDDPLLTIVHFIELKCINNFKVSIKCIDLLNKVLQQKFNIYDDENKLIVGANSEKVVQLIGACNSLKLSPNGFVVISNIIIKNSYFDIIGKKNPDFFDKSDYRKCIHYGILYDENILSVAIRLENDKAVTFLIENGTQVKDEYLIDAILGKTGGYGYIRIQIIKILIQHGANPYHKHNNQNLLEYAMSNHINSDVINYLYETYKLYYKCPYDDILFDL